MPSNIIEVEDTYLFNMYVKKKLALVRGENATVWDEDGNAFIDCVSGHGVTNLGHGNQSVAEAIFKQAKTLINCSPLFYNDARAKLAQRLVEITPGSVTRAFLCNSGTEAIEAALKFARFTTGKTDFICAVDAFHGRTFGAMSATYKEAYKAPYAPLVPGFDFVPFNDFDALKDMVTEKTAGILLEPLQGEGGVHIAAKDYLGKVQTLCRDTGILFILDEIQSGFCRTGKMFAADHFDAQPDMLCLAKAIAGGVPMGAAVCSERVNPPVGRHGTTFGGNPLSSAAALAAIDFMLENDLAAQAAEKGAYFAREFSEKPLSRVRELRSLGLMIGVELNVENGEVIQKCMEKGLLVFPAGKEVIRVFPPLTISYEELDRVIGILREILA